MAEFIKKELLLEGEWVNQYKIHYKSPDGKARTWESTERTTRKGDFDGVEILAFIPGEKTKIILVEQYRPPMQSSTIELPAGLAEEGETPSQSALRELEEETGYKGIVKGVSEEGCLEPGLSNANTVLVTIECPPEMNLHPEQKLDENEFITIHIVAVDELGDFLQSCNQRGVIPDAKLFTFQMGLSFTSIG